MKIYTSSSTKQWYTVYIHNNEGAASMGYDTDTRDVIRIKCESDDEAFVKACDLIEEHWEDPDDAFDCLKNQDVTSGDPFVYAIEDPNEELIFDLGFKDIEEYFEDIESCVTVEASTKYYGLFEYFPGSPEDGMYGDSFDLLEVVEAPSEDAATRMLDMDSDDGNQFVRELTKEDYDLYGVDLIYPLDPSKISSSETSHKSNVEATANFVEHTYEVTVGDVESYSVNAVSEEAAIQFVIDNYFTREDEEEYEDDPNYIWAELIEDDITASSDIWPEELTYDEYDEGDQIIDAFIEVIDDLGFFEEPSAQGGMGSDFIYDENDNLILEIDLQEEKDILTDMYYSSTNRKDFKKKIRDWIRSESSGSDVFSSNTTKSYEYKGCRIYDTGNGYNIYREGRLISNILFETTSDAEEFVREYLGVDSSTAIMSSSSKERKIRSSYGDVVLTKFVLVPMEYLEQYPDNYSKELEGYFYTWNYTYNKFTHDTDDRNKSHSSFIDSLPAPIRIAARELNIWGKTDWFKNSKRFIIVNEEHIDLHQIAIIRRACNV